MKRSDLSSFILLLVPRGLASPGTVSFWSATIPIVYQLSSIVMDLKSYRLSSHFMSRRVEFEPEIQGMSMVCSTATPLEKKNNHLLFQATCGAGS